MDFSSTPKLGFGLMRLPKLENGSIDVEQVKVMVDKFMTAGLTYFDTAWVYGDGASENAAREALVERYPRDSYTLATKLAVWDYTQKEDLEKMFNQSLTRTGAGYIDFYLAHNVNRNNIADFDRLDVWGYIQDLKKKGLVKYAGFSFHDNADMLDELLTKHPYVDFVQLQLNYIDWESDNVQSRKCYEVARKHGKQIIVMEPVKGGALANLNDDIKKLFTDVNPDLSVPSWAIRYVASLDGIITVLSGMSNIEQMDDNLSYMKDFKPLNEKEQETIKKAVEMLNAIPTVPCTACEYCVRECPMNINIPGIIKALNGYRVYNNLEKQQTNYNDATKDGGKASDCVKCGACENHCPQHLPIPEIMAEAAEVFEK